MKLAELVEKASNLIGEKLDCPEIYVDNVEWKENEVPDSFKAVWVTQGPARQTGSTFWYEAKIKDDKLESLTRWYSDDSTDPRQVETIKTED